MNLPWRNEPQDHYFEVELTPSQRAALLLLLEGKAITVRTRNVIEDAVRDSRRVDMRLSRERLDWGGVEAEARRQGCSIADIIFDQRGPTR